MLAMFSPVTIETPVPLTNVAALSLFWHPNLGMHHQLDSLLCLHNSTGQGQNDYVSAERNLQRKPEIVSDRPRCITEQ